MRIIEKAGQKVSLGVLTLTLFSLSWNALPETIPAGASQAAEDGLRHFLGLIPPGEEGNYGFSPADRLEKAEVGVPLRLYTITPFALENYRPGAPVGSLISPTGIWYFPVLIDGEAKAILTVGRVDDGSWQAVGLGKAALSKELQKVRERWPAAEGYDPVLIAVFQAAAYFFTVPQKDDFNLTPLIFTGAEIGAELQKTGERYSSLVNFSRLVENLKAAVKENIGQGY